MPWLLLLTLLGAPAERIERAEPVKRGWDFAGLPLLNFTTDRGFGYGAYLATYYHGAEGAAPDPYRVAIGAQFYQTSGGYAFHKLLLDFPSLAFGIRFDLLAGYERWERAWYFGRDSRSPRLLPERTPDDFYAADLTSFWAVPQLRIPLGGRFRLFLSATLRQAAVAVYRGSRLDLERPIGIGGGFLSQPALGLIYDSRDREPSPRWGVFSEISFRGAAPFTGSEFRYGGLNVTHRQWFSLSGDARWVLALRLGADYQFGAVPFFQEPVLGGSQWVEVGGNLSLRGLPVGRYRGGLTLYGSLELRYSALAFRIKRSRFELMLVSFFDAGRAGGGPLLPLRVSGGGGPRLSYNEVFVVRFDAAVALEEYAEVPLTEQARTRGAVFGFYGIVQHPF